MVKTFLPIALLLLSGAPAFSKASTMDQQWKDTDQRKKIEEMRYQKNVSPTGNALNGWVALERL